MVTRQPDVNEFEMKKIIKCQEKVSPLLPFVEKFIFS